MQGEGDLGPLLLRVIVSPSPSCSLCHLLALVHVIGPVLIPRTPEQSGSIFPCLSHASCLPYSRTFSQTEPGMAITTQLWTPHSITDLLCDPEQVTPPLWSLLFLLGSDSSGGRGGSFPDPACNPQASCNVPFAARGFLPRISMIPWTNNCHRVNPHRLHCAGGSAMVISHPQPHR